MLRLGTTTVEAKSGYGLDVKNELKCLEVIRALDRAHPVKLVPTFLGAHAIPPRFVRNKEGYVRLVREQMLPRVAKRELARYCDVFCEAGAFSTDDARDILKAAQRVGMGLKLHADELSYTGGAELAAELGATSADHLDHISREGIEAMARVGVIGVLLPGVPFHLMTERYAPARRMISSGVAIALATDYNPGSCPIPSMQFILSLACRRLKLTPAQAIAAATINAAHAVGLAKEVGSLEVGKLADVIILDVPNHRHIPYHLARNLVSTVIKGGKIV
jgi:imidazolonepropionase